VKSGQHKQGFFIIIIAEVLVSFFLSLSLYPEELSRGHQRYKKRSLSLFLLAQTVSLNHFSIYHTYIVKIIAIIAISRARGLSRPVFSAPEKRAIRARNLFFLYLFLSLLDIFGSKDLYDYFLCNHKHIQSFVNSVLIIAKALSLSFSCALVYY